MGVAHEQARCSRLQRRYREGPSGQGVRQKSRTSNYGTMFAGVESADKPAYSLHALERAHGLRVDTLLIDCEGCGNHFLAGTPGILKRVHTA